MSIVREFHSKIFGCRASQDYQSVTAGDAISPGFSFAQIGPNGFLRGRRCVLVFLAVTGVFGTWEFRLFTRTDLTQVSGFHQIVNALNLSGITAPGNFALGANLEANVGNSLFGETLLLGANVTTCAAPPCDVQFVADAVVYN